MDHGRRVPGPPHSGGFRRSDAARSRKASASNMERSLPGRRSYIARAQRSRNATLSYSVLCSSSVSAQQGIGSLFLVFGECAGNHEGGVLHACRAGPLGDLRPFGRAAIDAAAAGRRIMTGRRLRPAALRAALSATRRAAASQPSSSPRSARRCPLDLGEHQHRGLDALQPGEHGLRRDGRWPPVGARRTLADKPRDGHAGGLGALADALPFGVRGHHRARVPSRVRFVLHSLCYCYVASMFRHTIAHEPARNTHGHSILTSP